MKNKAMIYGAFATLCLFFVFIAACSVKNKKGEAGAFSIPPAFSESSFDVAAGKILADSGNANGATACVTCHAEKGAGNAPAGIPRLATMSRFYLVAQLEAFRVGQRENAIMLSIAKAMTDAEIQNVSGYYESLTGVPYPKMPSATTAQMKRAMVLSNTGDQTLRVQACSNCHGTGGIGMSPNIPYLKGQSASYIEAQLQAWKTDHRKTNPEHMGAIAKLLSDADIKSLAHYFQQIPNQERK